jgi:hypothetical protein
MFDDVLQSGFVIPRNEFDPIASKLKFIAAISFHAQPIRQKPKHLYAQHSNPAFSGEFECFLCLRQWK